MGIYNMALDLTARGLIRLAEATIRLPEALRQDSDAPPSTLYSLLEQGYSRAIGVYRCVDKIIRAAEVVPIKLVDRGGEKEEEVFDDRVLGVLARPNPRMTGVAFKQAALGQLPLAGNSYIYKIKNGAAQTRELWLLPSASVEPVFARPGEGGLGEVLRYDFMGESPSTIAAQDMIWLKNMNQADPYGMGLSSISIGRYIIDSDNKAVEWNRSMLSKAMSPSGVFTSKDTIADKLYAKMIERLDKRWAGHKKAGKPLLLDNSMEWTQTSINPKDAEWLAGRKMNLLEFALLFDIPPEMLGLQDHKTYANYKEARQAFYTDTILPILNDYCLALTLGFVHEINPNYWLVPDVYSLPIFREADDMRWERMGKAVDRGIMNRNEARERIGDGLDPNVPGGEIFTTASPTTPVTASEGWQQDKAGGEL